MSDGKIIQENGENIMPITHEACVLDANGNPLDEVIGDTSLLKTESKNITSAINEVFSDIIKQQIIDSLINNGVEINPGDSWSTIIEKMKEPVRGTGLNIISATELPAVGEENQICVVMDNPINQYLLISNNKPATSTDSIILSYGVGEPNYVYNYENQHIEYNFYKASNNGTNFKSYYWKDSKWNILTHDFVSVVENGVTPTPGGTISLLTTTSGPCYQFVEAGEEDYLSVPALTSSSHITSTTEPINFDLYNKIEIDAKTTFGSAKALYIGFSTTKRSPAGVTSSVSTYCSKYTNSQAINSNVKTTYVYDISEFTGTGYLVLYTSTANVGLGIINIRLYS